MSNIPGYVVISLSLIGFVRPYVTTRIDIIEMCHDDRAETSMNICRGIILIHNAQAKVQRCLRNHDAPQQIMYEVFPSISLIYEKVYTTDSHITEGRSHGCLKECCLGWSAFHLETSRT